MQHLLDLLVLRRQHVLNDGHEKRGLILSAHVMCLSTYMSLSVQCSHNDPPQSLELDLFRTLLKRVPELLGGWGVDEIIVYDRVARRCRVHVA